MINDILNDIEKIDAICFIHEHRMMNALSELYAKQQMILEYTKNEIAQEFTVFQESVLPEDDDREIHEFVNVPKQRYEVYTDDDDKFESFIMEMFVQKTSSTNPTEFPDDPNNIDIDRKDYMYKGAKFDHSRIAIQMAMCFNISHEVHNNETGDGQFVTLDPNLAPLIQLENKANRFVNNQSAYKKMGKKVYIIYQTLKLVQNDRSGIFAWHVVKDYKKGNANIDLTMGKHDKDPAMMVYFDANIPKRAVTKSEVRAMKAAQYIPMMQTEINTLKSRSDAKQTEIKKLEDKMNTYKNYVNKTLKGVKISTIRKEACLDVFDKKYILSQQVSFHLPRSGSNKATRLKNSNVLTLLNNIFNTMAQTATSRTQFYNHNRKCRGISAAKMIVNVFHIGPQ